MRRVRIVTATPIMERAFVCRTAAKPIWYTNKQHATPQPTTDRVEV